MARSVETDPGRPAHDTTTLARSSQTAGSTTTATHLRAPWQNFEETPRQGLWAGCHRNTAAQNSTQAGPATTTHILQAMEAKAELPTQLTMSLVVMLAKNEKVERPITLTSVLYRVWCRMRKPILDAWQQSLPPSMDYDRARPGATALHVALERLLRQETAKSLEKHGITVLLDMSTFYDTLDLQQLQPKTCNTHPWPWSLPCRSTLVTRPFSQRVSSAHGSM